MTQDELNVLIAANKDSPEHIQLVGIDASNLVFDSVDLTGAHLQHSNFTNASFKNAKLNGANCVVSIFNGADFTGADLSDIKIELTAFDAHTKWIGATWGGQVLTQSPYMYRDGYRVLGTDTWIQINCCGMALDEFLNLPITMVEQLDQDDPAKAVDWYLRNTQRLRDLSRRFAETK